MQFMKKNPLIPEFSCILHFGEFKEFVFVFALLLVYVQETGTNLVKIQIPENKCAKWLPLKFFAIMVLCMCHSLSKLSNFYNICTCIMVIIHLLHILCGLRQYYHMLQYCITMYVNFILYICTTKQQYYIKWNNGIVSYVKTLDQDMVLCHMMILYHKRI